MSLILLSQNDIVILRWPLSEKECACFCFSDVPDELRKELVKLPFLRNRFCASIEYSMNVEWSETVYSGLKNKNSTAWILARSSVSDSIPDFEI